MNCEMTLTRFGVVVMAMMIASGGAVGDDGFRLHLLDAATGALCLDGSAAGFYHRPGASNASWIVHFEGGGWCVDQADCEQRAQTAIGSSKGQVSAAQITLKVRGLHSKLSLTIHLHRERG